MKLLLCPACLDMFSLRKEEKHCSCGQTRGRYITGIYAVYSGGIPLGIANASLKHAIHKRPKEGFGHTFDAWVVPVNCSTFTKED